jgi:hypothetical protein
MRTTRRDFTGGLAATATALPLLARPARAAGYRGPNVIIIRFGGGVRRAETILPATSFAPFLLHDLIPRGTLIPDLRIDQSSGGETSHAEGTLNILSGRYRAYRPAGGVIGDRLEPVAPTLFEYLRKAFDIPAHQTLLVNGEDRPQEEYFSYGVHRRWGVEYRSEVLSLYRFKLSKLRRMLEARDGTEAGLAAATEEYGKLQGFDYRGLGTMQVPEIEGFWIDWEARYGRSGLVNPRGDRLLTELALAAMDRLQPRLMMVNYQDTDYVHWGVPSHYTQAVAIIDSEIRRLVSAADASDAYRGNTVFVVVPDCGRDSNPLMDVPFQHHFNSPSAHEIFALFFGAGIPASRVIDRPLDQTAIAPTIAALMGFDAPEAEGSVAL